MLPKIIGMDLLADAQPGAHQCHADLGAAEPHDLDIGGERGRPGEIGIGHRDDNDRQKRERLADRLQDNDGDEIAPRPIVGQLRSEQVSDGEGRQPNDQHAAGIEMPEQKDRQGHRHKHRQRPIDHQQLAGLLGSQPDDGAEKIRHQR